MAFYHQIPLPIKDESGPSLTSEEFKEKKKAYKKGILTREETPEWVLQSTAVLLDAFETGPIQ
jgi:hypothetical protein